ncbi:TIGR03643 family protein [Alphaproteobacteria bacterium]|nr:TIGR03643 family protein [Alphaproteobacteria bacterium]MDC3270110.1 TIGR03643 family protein [Alphaproteobacteria bacterium]
MQHVEYLTDNIIKLAWSDKVSFEKIERLHGKSESEVIKIMRKNLKPKSFKLWRERVSGRTRKHEKKRSLSSKPFKAEDYV